MRTKLGGCRKDKKREIDLFRLGSSFLSLHTLNKTHTKKKEETFTPSLYGQSSVSFGVVKGFCPTKVLKNEA